MSHYSIKVERITVQPEKLSVTKNPDELDVARLKRAKIWVIVTRDRIPSKFLIVIHFSGRVMVLTRAEGPCSAFTLAEILWEDYERMYSRADINYVDSREDGSMCECTILDPVTLVGYFHFIHEAGLEVDWDR